MSGPLIYLVKIGDDNLEYDYLCDRLSLRTLNKELSDRYPILGNNDYALLKYAGGTIVYREFDPEKFVWVINLNHESNSFYRGTPISEKVFNMIDAVKRDIKLSKIV